MSVPPQGEVDRIKARQAYVREFPYAVDPGEADMLADHLEQVREGFRPTEPFDWDQPKSMRCRQDEHERCQSFWFVVSEAEGPQEGPCECACHGA